MRRQRSSNDVELNSVRPLYSTPLGAAVQNLRFRWEMKMPSLKPQFLAQAALILVVMAASEGIAQQTKNGFPKPDTTGVIAVGQSINEALHSLRTRNIQFGEGGMAMVVSEDTSYYTFTLDENHSYATIYFSKSKNEVFAIEMTFFPHRTAQYKSIRSIVPATRLVLNEDGSYDVRFARPPTPEEVRRREAEAESQSQAPFPRVVR